MGSERLLINNVLGIPLDDRILHIFSGSIDPFANDFKHLNYLLCLIFKVLGV